MFEKMTNASVLSEKKLPLKARTTALSLKCACLPYASLDLFRLAWRVRAVVSLGVAFARGARFVA